MKAFQQTADLHQFLALMERRSASDLHLKEGSPPILRIAGKVVRVDSRGLTSAEIERMAFQVLDDTRRRRFERLGDVDFAVSPPAGGRYRINLFRQRGWASLAVRRVNTVIPTFDELQLPEGVRRLADMHQGLIIVAGPTGCGKSTTLASMIERINQTKSRHIVTIEDPIEYLFQDKECFIDQREVGIDVASWKEALKHVVRQDPDVILIGEMRDQETFQAGLTASETGHMVFGTLHSSTVGQTFGRILDLFPSERHAQIAHSLSFNLRGMVCQKLLPACEPPDTQVPTCEILIVNPSTRKLIHELEFSKIPDALRIHLHEGMLDFNTSLAKLFQGGKITRQVAFEASSNVEALKMVLQGIDVGASSGLLGRS
ncbi:MAG: PilT/PilU family type 4a pilus ATPase [Planctomycetota bacterium]